MCEFLKEILGQFVALATFFAFPAIQYLLLRRFSRNEGNPQLWFLPAYGFRLVIRNLVGKRTYSELKLRSKIRSVVAESSGSSVKTFVEDVLIDREDFFLFPGNDEIIISFRLETSQSGGADFIVTNKLGAEQRRIPLDSFDTLICDYSAYVKYFFDFGIKVAKRVELSSKTLGRIFAEIQKNPVEGSFDLDRIRHVG
jgi:hypothetical protein